jgi:hypothetical protein
MGSAAAFTWREFSDAWNVSLQADGALDAHPSKANIQTIQTIQK